MPPSAAIPAATRKTLLEWIETDGDTTSSTMPARSADLEAFHARIGIAPGNAGTGPREPLQPPPGLRLAPLG